MNRNDYIATLAEAKNGKAAIYIRRATVSQTRMGNDLRELTTQILITFAHEHGFTDEQLVIFNDTGLPASAPLEKREGLQGLIRAIEHDEVKAVLIGSEYSLYRDAQLADILFFILLCQRHHVVVITPDMLYDFTNPVHAKLFQFRLEGVSFVIYARKVHERKVYARNRSRQQKEEQK